MIVGLLFTATVINYVDRQMLGVLKPTLKADLNWSELNFAAVVFVALLLVHLLSPRLAGRRRLNEIAGADSPMQMRLLPRQTYGRRPGA